jgi:hypothetical protein
MIGLELGFVLVQTIESQRIALSTDAKKVAKNPANHKPEKATKHWLRTSNKRGTNFLFGRNQERPNNATAQPKRTS